MQPIHLGPNQPAQFYRGGGAIAEFRGVADAAARANFGPEDWVASTVTLYGRTDGLTALPDGRLLRDAIAADPVGYLGQAHVDVHGADPALLVKLLDAGQRLPVHVHPDREFARRHLDCPYGKTESWLIVETRGDDAAVYLGFSPTSDPRLVSEWIAGQRSDLLLGALNRVPVRPGDTMLVPAGTPHAIDAGVFLVELQEPTDFSVMLEWKAFGLDDRGTEQLGLSSQLALSCIAWEPFDDARLESCVTRRAMSDDEGSRSLLPTEADDFFRAEHVVVRGSVTLGAQFSILVVLGGSGQLAGDTSAFGAPIDVTRGDTVLVPHGAGDVLMSGRLDVVRCLPPGRSAA